MILFHENKKIPEVEKVNKGSVIAEVYACKDTEQVMQTGKKEGQEPNRDILVKNTRKVDLSIHCFQPAESLACKKYDFMLSKLNYLYAIHKRECAAFVSCIKNQNDLAEETIALRWFGLKKLEICIKEIEGLNENQNNNQKVESSRMAYSLDLCSNFSYLSGGPLSRSLYFQTFYDAKFFLKRYEEEQRAGNRQNISIEERETHRIMSLEAKKIFEYIKFKREEYRANKEQKASDTPANEKAKRYRDLSCFGKKPKTLAEDLYAERVEALIQETKLQIEEYEKNENNDEKASRASSSDSNSLMEDKPPIHSFETNESLEDKIEKLYEELELYRAEYEESQKALKQEKASLENIKPDELLLEKLINRMQDIELEIKQCNDEEEELITASVDSYKQDGVDGEPSECPVDENEEMYGFLLNCAQRMVGEKPNDSTEYIHNTKIENIIQYAAQYFETERRKGKNAEEELYKSPEFLDKILKKEQEILENPNISTKKKERHETILKEIKRRINCAELKNEKNQCNPNKTSTDKISELYRVALKFSQTIDGKKQNASTKDTRPKRERFILDDEPERKKAALKKIIDLEIFIENLKRGINKKNEYQKQSRASSSHSHSLMHSLTDKIEKLHEELALCRVTYKETQEALQKQKGLIENIKLYEASLKDLTKRMEGFGLKIKESKQKQREEQRKKLNRVSATSPELSEIEKKISETSDKQEIKLYREIDFLYEERKIEKKYLEKLTISNEKREKHMASLEKIEKRIEVAELELEEYQKNKQKKPSGTSRLDSRYMKEDQPHIYFPEPNNVDKNLSMISDKKNAELDVDREFLSVVCEKEQEPLEKQNISPEKKKKHEDLLAKIKADIENAEMEIKENKEKQCSEKEETLSEDSIDLPESNITNKNPSEVSDKKKAELERSLDYLGFILKKGRDPFYIQNMSLEKREKHKVFLETIKIEFEKTELEMKKYKKIKPKDKEKKPSESPAYKKTTRGKN